MTTKDYSHEYLGGHGLVLPERDSQDTICPSTGLLQYSFMFKFNMIY